MKEEKFLPIGSVVLLKNAKKRLMITGYLTVDMENMEKVYDYCGCLFPEGIINTKNTLMFNHGDIEKIYCIGYEDDEEKEFMTKIRDLATEENIGNLLKEAKEKNKEIESL